MNIGIIDADLLYGKRHRFPNLACMKISSFHKRNDNSVTLLDSFNNLSDYDLIYVSKVFTDTFVPENVLNAKNVQYGGTGFFYDKAPKLPNEIEHIMPDYHLYDTFSRRTEFKMDKYFTDYSIGFLTRGCFRKCPFCVNKNYEKVEIHAPLSEFYDPTRKKICLLDDNFLGHPEWERMLNELKATNRPFQFKQGLDERLLTDKKCEALFTSKYDGDFIFAFDNYKDAELIERKIKLAKRYTNANMKFYCFTAFDRDDKWDFEFWERDIFELLYRIEILMRNKCLPYVMRYARYEESPYRGMYITLARYCNQPSFYKKKSIREFCLAHKENSSPRRYLEAFEKKFPQATSYLDMKYGQGLGIKNGVI